MYRFDEPIKDVTDIQYGKYYFDKMLNIRATVKSLLLGAMRPLPFVSEVQLRIDTSGPPPY